jgi:beta-xylosidase
MQAYRAALELYDLRMAYMLIAASQKDPAEHLEELQMFVAIEDPSMHRFAIDRKLGRHQMALRHVVEAGPAHAEEAREFAAKHGLMKELLDLLRGRTQDRMAALHAYAQACTAIRLTAAS